MGQLALGTRGITRLFKHRSIGRAIQRKGRGRESLRGVVSGMFEGEITVSIQCIVLVGDPTRATNPLSIRM